MWIFFLLYSIIFYYISVYSIIYVHNMARGPLIQSTCLPGRQGCMVWDRSVVLQTNGYTPPDLPCLRVWVIIAFKQMDTPPPDLPCLRMYS